MPRPFFELLNDGFRFGNWTLRLSNTPKNLNRALAAAAAVAPIVPVTAHKTMSLLIGNNNDSQPLEVVLHKPNASATKGAMTIFSALSGTFFNATTSPNHTVPADYTLVSKAGNFARIYGHNDTDPQILDFTEETVGLAYNGYLQKLPPNDNLAIISLSILASFVLLLPAILLFVYYRQRNRRAALPPAAESDTSTTHKPTAISLILAVTACFFTPIFLSMLFVFVAFLLDKGPNANQNTTDLLIGGTDDQGQDVLYQVSFFRSLANETQYAINILPLALSNLFNATTNPNSSLPDTWHTVNLYGNGDVGDYAAIAQGYSTSNPQMLELIKSILKFSYEAYLQTHPFKIFGTLFGIAIVTFGAVAIPSMILPFCALLIYESCCVTDRSGYVPLPADHGRELGSMPQVTDAQLLATQSLLAAPTDDPSSNTGNYGTMKHT